MTRRLLFTGGGGSGNEAIFRLWKERYELHFADADPRLFAPSLPSDKCHQIPFANDPEFLPSLVALCRKLEIDVLVPGVDEELQLVSASKAVLSPTVVLLPDAEYVATMLDKLKASQTLLSHGLNVPTTCLAGHHTNARFPSIIKPRSGHGSRGVQLANSAPQVDAYLELYDGKPDEIIVQDYFDGPEFTVLMAADNDANLRAIVPVEVALKKGVTILGSTRQNADVIEYCALLHDKIPTPGCYNVQLINSPTSGPMPFEINPRISTTFCLVVAAGLDPVAIYLGIEDGLPENFRWNTTITRSWFNSFGLSEQ